MFCLGRSTISPRGNTAYWAVVVGMCSWQWCNEATTQSDIWFANSAGPSRPFLAGVGQTIQKALSWPRGGCTSAPCTPQGIVREDGVGIAIWRRDATSASKDQRARRRRGDARDDEHEGKSANAVSEPTPETAAWLSIDGHFGDWDLEAHHSLTGQWGPGLQNATAAWS